MKSFTLSTFLLFSFCQLARGHVAAWHKGMYCLNGTERGVINQNSADAVQPLFNLRRDDWWFHHVNNCDQFPPAPGDFLELPAGGTFTVEHAVNQAYTSLSFGGRNVGDWVNGESVPNLGDSNRAANGEMPCIGNPNLHTQNETMAAGTAFAISYESDITRVTPENLVIFTVAYNTPWRRIATYSVPAAMPACPPEGCICGWGWVPNGCGEPNMYMLPYRCTVTNVSPTSSLRLAPAQPGVWCEDDPSRCTRGAKQMIFWNQAEANNIEVSGSDLSGHPRSPAYNAKLGFADGAQNDIFLAASAASATSTSTVTTFTTQRATATAPIPTATSSDNPRPTENHAIHASIPSTLLPLCLCFILLSLSL